jgi:hypothetical protein
MTADAFEGRPFSDDPLVAAVERACVAAGLDDPPTGLKIHPDTFDELRNAAAGLMSPILSAGPTVNSLFQLTAAVDPDMTDRLLLLDGFRDPTRQLWIDNDPFSERRYTTHSLRFCAGGDDMTGCHDMSVYTSCGHENCYGQDDYIGICECVCHND